MITNDSQMTGAIGESFAAAAGYKPAPQLGRQIAVYLLHLHHAFFTCFRCVRLTIGIA